MVRLLPALGLFALGVAVSLAGAWGAASGLALYGDAVARAAGGEPARLARAVELYGWAARLDRRDPAHPERQGRLLERLADAESLGSGASLKRLSAALELYREAAARRPTWPYVSVDIARVKVKLGMLDGELDAHLRWAWRCGAWSLRVQRELLGIGLAAWPLLGPDSRRFFDDVLDRMLREQPAAAIDLSLDLGRRDLIEGRTAGSERLRALLETRARLRSADTPR
jgi:hypothetical protein